MEDREELLTIALDAVDDPDQVVRSDVVAVRAGQPVAGRMHAEHAATVGIASEERAGLVRHRAPGMLDQPVRDVDRDPDGFGIVAWSHPGSAADA